MGLRIVRGGVVDAEAARCFQAQMDDLGQVARAAGFEPMADAEPPLEPAYLDEPEPPAVTPAGVFDFEVRAA